MKLCRFRLFSSISVLISGFWLPLMVASMGVNYGQIANNLPPPEKVIPLVKSIGATKVKLYDANPQVLRAFANSGVELTVGLGNEYLSQMKYPRCAEEWVKTNVLPFLPATKITAIFVGNEVLTFNDTSLSNRLLPAMENVHTALVNLGLEKQILVTTAHSLAILETSYPPSTGRFRRDLVDCLTPILTFHSKTGSPFLINAYPYFAYKSNPKQVALDFVLFQPNQGVLDSATNLHYDNMLFAQIDAVYYALASIGFKKIPVHISETGWPSNGDNDEAGATLENAKKYNANLIKVLCQKKGTPALPNSELNIYVFALFNENMKPGPKSERNYGLFKPDGTPAYDLGLGKSSGGKNSTGVIPGAGGEQSPVSTSSTGYLSFSSGQERKGSLEVIQAWWMVFLMSGIMFRNW